MAVSNLLRNIKPITDSDEQLREHLLSFLLIRVILYTLLLGITFLLHTREHHLILPPPALIVLYIFCIYVYSISSALLLRRTLHLRRFGLVQLLSDTVFIALLVYATGCSQSIFPSVFILPIIAGGLILYRIGGLIPAASATILYAIVLTSEYLGLLPSYYDETYYIEVDNFLVGMNIFAVYGLTFFLIALLSGIIATRLRTTEDALSRTELKLDRLLLLYKQIFNDILTGIITVDDQDRITSFNPAAENITGFTAHEVNRRRLNEIFPRISVETQERLVADLQRKDGTLIRVGYSCANLNIPSGTERDNSAISNSKVITLQDISRIEKMEKQMRKAEKMAAIGEMSASIAHDFRNPLAAISGSAQLLAMELEDQAPGERSVKNSLAKIILRESERMSSTITDFLHYARPSTPEPQWFNLRRMAEETVALMTSEDAGTCPIRLDIPDALDIYADRQQLQLALRHLLRNSCYAAKNSPEPVIIQATEMLANGMRGEQVIIDISDQGEGVDPGIVEKAFEPFFTTREDTAGLGLTIVRQIMASHNGTIALIPGPERGCTVRIQFPLPLAIP
ncbi:MAG TPA: PAS domain-containing sensor histidine kinase [Desulfobulbaceae bacterium]|nr:PAS domain-containing sensor histidine kinase [Desulfobulbaceae bacterium]